MTAAYPSYDAPGRRVSGAGYWVGALIIVTGVVAGMIVLGTGVGAFIRSFTDIQELTGSEVGDSLDLDTGDHVLYSDSLVSLAPESVEVIETATGQPIPVRPLAISSEVTLNDRTWQGVARFTVDRSGPHVITVRSEFSNFAVGPEAGFDDAVPFLVGLLIGTLALILGGSVIGVTWLRRGRSLSPSRSPEIA